MNMSGNDLFEADSSFTLVRISRYNTTYVESTPVVYLNYITSKLSLLNRGKHERITSMYIRQHIGIFTKMADKRYNFFTCNQIPTFGSVYINNHNLCLNYSINLKIG